MPHPTSSHEKTDTFLFCFPLARLIKKHYYYYHPGSIGLDGSHRGYCAWRFRTRIIWKVDIESVVRI